MTAPDEIRSRAAGLLADLERLVGIPSVAFPGYPPEPVRQMANEALRLFREAGFANAELQQVLTGYPPVHGEIHASDDEGVDSSEIERMILARAFLVQQLEITWNR